MNEASVAERDHAIQRLVSELKTLLGDRCTTADSVRSQHGHGESYHPPAPPDAVCYVQTTEEVSAVVKLCRTYRVPIIPFGAGSSLEGHVHALYGGVCVDLSGMTKILEVHREDFDATVQAGVTRQQLNAHLRDTGLFFPVDPGAHATLAGMAATRASGTNAVRYGTMRENVISLTVVLADGKIIRTASRARKSSAGYDLTRLFVGSEGTLGIITELTIRLYGVPEIISAVVCSFPNVECATHAAIECIHAGVPVARVELMDDLCMRAINTYNELSYPETPTLFLEFHGTPRGVEEQAEIVREISFANGGSNWRAAANLEERNRLWEARHKMHDAQFTLRPGAKVWGTDACVPLSQLATCISDIREHTQKASFPITTLGHVGDGNFHLGFLINPDDPKEVAEAMELNSVLVRRAIALGGTCTGEHGIGYGKKQYLSLELGDGAVETMQLLKTALDPDGIFNPGKVLPDV